MRAVMLRHTGTTKHAFVIGSGIAGLSLAEILSRNGFRITLLEASKDLGGDASRSTQNWLHTGWLYAGLPCPSAMRCCARALRLFRRTYDPVLPSDVVNVEADERGVAYPASSRGWFAAEAMHYAFAVSARDLSPIQRLTWTSYLDRIVLRRLRQLGYPTDAVSELPPAFADLMRHWEGTDEGHERYRVIPSTDVRIDTKRVLGSLLRLLGSQTEVVTGAEPELVRRGSRIAVRLGGELHTPDLCVIAAGSAVPRLLAQAGEEAIARSFKSISSPIVVLGRALELPNFIRFTPNLPETINHVKYAVGGGDLSTVGSYEYYPAHERPDITPFVEKVCRRLGVPSSDVVGSYYGTKTELTGRLARQYNHAVEPIGSNAFFAIAGKFSQFPLLVNEFAVKTGLRVDIANEERGTLALDVADTAPERVAQSAGIHTERTAA